MKKFLFASLLAFSITGCATADYAVTNQGTISKEILEKVNRESRRATAVLGFGSMTAQIPSYDGKGLLFASWTPQKNVHDSHTFVIIHGGHGVGSVDWKQAQRLRDEFNANILVLDSYWSRGHEQNWQLNEHLNATARTFDVVAAGRWLIKQGTDPKKTYLIGGSQGGWTVLRAFTNDSTTAELVKPLYSKGISLYPYCKDWTLAPYHSPVLILTGGQDESTPLRDCPTKVTKLAAQWINYPEGTHAWDLATHGAVEPSVDGVCARSKNPVRFLMCYNASVTNKMYEDIAKFIQ